MGRRLMRIAVAIFFFTGITPFAWGAVKQVTIIYSSAINGQVDPSG